MSYARYAPLALFLLVCAWPARAAWIGPFISEIHYDNAGTDSNEFVAVSGQAGFDLAGWRVLLYNGSDGQGYGEIALSGRLDGNGGWGEAFWPKRGIQNGPDALALVSPADQVVEFVAYEGAVKALTGAAAGMSAALLPVAEDNATPAGWSLQRTGAVEAGEWLAAVATPGTLNAGLQLQTADATTANALPTTGGLPLWLAALPAMVLMARRRRAERRLPPPVAALRQ